MASHSLLMPAWLVFLRMNCALAEGVAELVDQASNSGAAACVFAVLADPQRRIAAMGGREGMPRSLGSVYGGSVTRFLNGFRGRMSRSIAAAGASSFCGGVAVSRDGSALLVSDHGVDFDAIHVVSVHTSALLRIIGGPGSGPLQFSQPYQVWVASDGFVFVADSCNDRIQVLTPRYAFHSFVGVGQLHRPLGVCANDDVLVVTEHADHRLSVFSRNDGALVGRFGEEGSGDGQLLFPNSVCFMSGHRQVAVADYANGRVSVWTLEGMFVRHVGEGKIKRAMGIACSNDDELVVADCGNRRVVVFSVSGEIKWTAETTFDGLTGVAIHGDTIYGQTSFDGVCAVFS